MILQVRTQYLVSQLMASDKPPDLFACAFFSQRVATVRAPGCRLQYIPAHNAKDSAEYREPMLPTRVRGQKIVNYQQLAPLVCRGFVSGQGRRSCFHRFVGTVRAAGAYQTSRHLIGARFGFSVLTDSWRPTCYLFCCFLLAALRICLIAEGGGGNARFLLDFTGKEGDGRDFFFFFLWRHD